jgi:Ca-activated chloride channel family protein
VNNFPGVGPLRYQPEVTRTVPTIAASVAKELLYLSISYKNPEGAQDKRIDVPLVDRGQSFDNASIDFRFAAAVAEFGMLLRNSSYRGTSTWESAIAIARASRGADKEGYREEFIRLVQQCEQIVRTAGR